MVVDSLVHAVKSLEIDHVNESISLFYYRTTGTGILLCHEHRGKIIWSIPVCTGTPSRYA